MSIIAEFHVDREKAVGSLVPLLGCVSKTIAIHFKCREWHLQANFRGSGWPDTQSRKTERLERLALVACQPGIDKFLWLFVQSWRFSPGSWD